MEMHRKMEEAAERAFEESERGKKFHSGIITENTNLTLNLTEKVENITQQRAEIERLRHRFIDAERISNELRESLRDMEEIKRQNKQYKSDILLTNKERSDLQDLY
jgi:hypothetical protein